MKRLSVGEETFMHHCMAVKLECPEREFLFAIPRRWRFDFAWPYRKVAVEIEGGLHMNGRHNRAAGMEKDMEKYNTAAILGWCVLRYSTAMVHSGQAINEVEAFFASQRTQEPRPGAHGDEPPTD